MNKFLLLLNFSKKNTNSIKLSKEDIDVVVSYIKF